MAFDLVLIPPYIYVPNFDHERYTNKDNGQLNRRSDDTPYDKATTAPSIVAVTFISSCSSKMPPRRSVRSKGPAYKKGDYIEVSTKVTSKSVVDVGG